MRMGVYKENWRNNVVWGDKGSLKKGIESVHMRVCSDGADGMHHS